MGEIARNRNVLPFRIFLLSFVSCELGLCQSSDTTLFVQIHLLRISTPPLLHPQSCLRGSISSMPICRWKGCTPRLWSGSIIEVRGTDEGTEAL